MKENSAVDAQSDPWGINKDKSSEDVALCFEDSFTSCVSVTSEGPARTYVPLDDSQQYLAGLEKKLARVQGKTLTVRESERKRLIAALAKSKEDHAIDLLSSSNETSEPSIECETSEPPNRNFNKGLTAIDPQGTLGLVMRKCAPDHVALSAEELCELLKADTVAKVHETLEMPEETKSSNQDCKNQNENGNTDHTD